MEKNNSIAASKEITGNAKIDERIGEWLRLDKVGFYIVQLYTHESCMLQSCINHADQIIALHWKMLFLCFLKTNTAIHQVTVTINLGF